MVQLEHEQSVCLLAGCYPGYKCSQLLLSLSLSLFNLRHISTAIPALNGEQLSGNCLKHDQAPMISDTLGTSIGVPLGRCANT